MTLLLSCTPQLVRDDGQQQEGEEEDLLGLWTSQSSPGQLPPLQPGRYQLTVRLVRMAR